MTQKAKLILQAKQLILNGKWGERRFTPFQDMVFLHEHPCPLINTGYIHHCSSVKEPVIQVQVSVPLDPAAAADKADMYSHPHHQVSSIVHRDIPDRLVRIRLLRQRGAETAHVAAETGR